MNNSKISVRYARALFEAATEAKLIDPVQKEVAAFAGYLKQLPELKEVLYSPVVTTGQKLQLVDACFGEQFSPLFLSFLHLLIRNKRENYLEIILLNFMTEVKNYSGIKNAVITSAYPLEKDTVEQLGGLIRTFFCTEAEITAKVKPEIIGGFILRIDDRQIDSSITTKLKQLKQELLK